MASFNNAFAAARKAGKSTFSWNGKKYNTKMAKTPKTPKNVPVPKAKPSSPSKASSNLQSTPAAPKPKQDYPRGPKAVGIARAGSPISIAASKRENKAKTVTPSAAPSKPVQGPIPEGVWYAKKGSAMSLGAMRRANKAGKPKPSGGGW